MASPVPISQDNRTCSLLLLLKAPAWLPSPCLSIYLLGPQRCVFLLLTQYLFPVRPIRFSRAGRRLTLIIFSLSSIIA